MKPLAIILALCLAASAQTGKHRALFGSTSPSGPVNTSPACQHVFDGTNVWICAFNANVTSGHLAVVAALNWTSNTIAVPSVPTDSCGTTYTLIGDTGLNTGNSNSRSWEWSGILACTGADTVSIDFGVGHEGTYTIGALEYVATTVDTSVGGFTNVGNASANVTANITTSHSNELLLVYCAEPTSDTTVNVSTAGYTAEIPLSIATNTFLASDKANIAAGAQSVTCNRTAPGSPVHVGFIGLY